MVIFFLPPSTEVSDVGTRKTSCREHCAEKAHDWAIDQLADLFRTTHKVKTQQVARIRGHRCGDIGDLGIVSTSGYFHCEFVYRLFLQVHREPNHFVTSSLTDVQFP